LARGVWIPQPTLVWPWICRDPVVYWDPGGLSPGGVFMPDWLWLVVAIAAWIVINRWVLPRFGVKT